jgi:CRP/FNR family transcriptional regulator
MKATLVSKLDPNLQKFDLRTLGRDESAEHEAIISALRKNAQSYKAGDQLTYEGDARSSTFFVLNGWILLSKSLPDGQTQIIDFVLPGDVATSTAADGKSSAVQVEALTDVTVAAMNNAEWTALIHKWPELEQRASELSNAARARISERMLRLGKGTAPMRVAYALLELGVRLRVLHGTEDLSFHIPLTQQRLGDFTGLTSVHVCRTLRRLDRHGIVATNDHMNILIKDLRAVSELAGVEIDDLRREIEATEF